MVDTAGSVVQPAPGSLVLALVWGGCLGSKELRERTNAPRGNPRRSIKQQRPIPGPSNRCFLVTGAQKPPVRVSKQPVGGRATVHTRSARPFLQGWGGPRRSGPCGTNHVRANWPSSYKMVCLLSIVKELNHKEEHIEAQSSPLIQLLRLTGRGWDGTNSDHE